MTHRRGLLRAMAIGVAVSMTATGCLLNTFDDTSTRAVSARLVVNGLLDQADQAEVAGDVERAGELREEAAAEECRLFGCEAPVGSTTFSMDAGLEGAFFDAPWPSDTRRRPDGSIDLTGFPGRSTIPLADVVLARGEVATDGFGTNSGIFFQATAALDETSLPIIAEGSTRRRGHALVIDLDRPDAPLVPVLSDVRSTGTVLRPANLVTLLPYPGHPLAPDTRYAAIMFDGVRDAEGNRLAPSPLIAQLDGPAPDGVDPIRWDQLRQDRDDVIDAIRTRTLWHPSDLVAFTAFTTQDPTTEMEAIAAAIDALDPPQVLSRTPATTPCTPGSVSRSSGRLALPTWQQGTRPFLEAGGEIVVGNDGRAVQQGVELGADGQGVLFDMAIPCGPSPAGGWPILLWMNGTGGSARAAPISQLGPDLPYAVLSIAPLYSGDRLAAAPPPFNTPDFQFFNYLNPVGARTNLIQQAADMIYLRRVAQHLTLAPGEAGGTTTNLDAEVVVLAGHSQGATTLPLTLAVDPQVDGAFLSASGGGLYHSIVYRADVRALVDGLLGTEPDELDVFHPYPQILQTFAEAGDAANYAPAVDTDVAIYAGLRDGCTAIEVSVHLAQAMGIPMATPQTRLPLFGPDWLATAPDYTSPFEPDIVALPVSENLEGGRTAVMVQVDAGHFGASTYPSIGRTFVDSIVGDGPVVVDPGPTPPVAPGSQCPRFGPAPTG